MSSLTFHLTKFDSDDIEKKASLKPKKLSKRRTKKQHFLTRNSYFILKCIIISITLFLFFHNIKLKLSTINNLKHFNQTTKQKTPYLHDSCSFFVIGIAHSYNFSPLWQIVLKSKHNYQKKTVESDCLFYLIKKLTILNFA